MPIPFGMLTTPGGFRMDEVVSAMQKCVRRGDERGALFFASEIDLAGYGGYVWRRLRIVCSEDVGLADPQAVLLVHALYGSWLESKKTKHEAELPLFLAHAVLVLARAAKSGIALSAVFTFWEGDRAAMNMQIPAHALDMFTGRGRRMGMGKEFFLEESGRRENETLENPYLESGAAAWLGETGRQTTPPAPEVPPADQLALGDEELG